VGKLSEAALEKYRQAPRGGRSDRDDNFPGRSAEKRSQSCTDPNSLGYNSLTGQGQLLWVCVCLRNGDLAWCPWFPLTSDIWFNGVETKGNPDSENDMIVKRVAERAELNCGQCVTKHGNKCAQGPYCRHFFLHKFRHTFATEHLRHGVDIRTLQSWMGHRDIKSTMVSLKSVQSKDALAKVNAGALAQYVA